MMNNYSKYLRCPKCGSDVEFLETMVSCQHCQSDFVVEDGIVKMLGELSGDEKISAEKWDEHYEKSLQTGDFLREFTEYQEIFFTDVYRNIASAKKIDKQTVYIEIGCGSFFFGGLIANQAAIIIGIDFSLASLKVAKKLFEKNGIKNYLLIQGDVLDIPIKSNSVDIVYGGGVIEHFVDTQQCVNNLFRVLKNNGVSLNTVPYLNLASLTYRQLWGNIPNFPILKQLAEFIHIKLLRKRHMIFGYELSFLASTLKKVHRNAGFNECSVSQFDIALSFDFMPKFLRPFFTFLAKNSRLFWPMVKVVGTKKLSEK